MSPETGWTMAAGTPTMRPMLSALRWNALPGSRRSKNAWIAATAKPVAAKAAMVMCSVCCNADGFNIARMGSIAMTRPPSRSRPAGVFIHEFAITTKTPESAPLTATRMPAARCARDETRSHPYRYTPRKIASVKNANPSRENGIPMMGPAKAMKRGQRSPSSKLSTVPETAPTAKSTAVPLAHRFARSR
jgi:hypothetical protein